MSINDNLSLWTQCANSGDNCSIGPGFFRVKFGSNNNWKSKSFSSKSQMNIPCSPEIFEFNFNWKKEKYSMVELSFGPNNIIMGITSNFEMMVKYPDKSWQLVDKDFKKVAINPITGEIWGINTNSIILYRVNLNENWQETAGSGEEIVITNTGLIWIVNNEFKSFYRDGFSQPWVFDGLLRKISVNRKTGLLWSISHEQKGFTRDGPSNPFVYDPTSYPKDFYEALITDDNQIFAITTKNEIYLKSGSNWIRFPGTFKKMFSDLNGKLYGITSTNEVYTYNPKEQLVCQYIEDPFKSLCRAKDKSCITYNYKPRFR